MAAIYYHRGDHDGVLSGYLLWSTHSELEPRAVEYHEFDAADFREHVPAIIADLAVKPPLLPRLQHCRGVVWYDHHETSLGSISTLRTELGWRVVYATDVLSTLQLLELDAYHCPALRARLESLTPVARHVIRLLGRYDCRLHFDDPEVVEVEMGLRAVRTEQFEAWWRFESGYAEWVCQRLNEADLERLRRRGRELFENCLQAARARLRGPVTMTVDGQPVPALWVGTKINGAIAYRLFEETGARLIVCAGVPGSRKVTVYTTGSLNAAALVAPVDGGGHATCAGCPWTERTRELFPFVPPWPWY